LYETGARIHSEEVKWSIIAKIYLEPSNFSCYGCWLAYGRLGLGKLPAFTEVLHEGKFEISVHSFSTT
jgi:hypothetical protein